MMSLPYSMRIHPMKLVIVSRQYEIQNGYYHLRTLGVVSQWVCDMVGIQQLLHPDKG